MSWIREEESTDPFNINKVMSIQPRAMRGAMHMTLGIHQAATELSEAQKEAIATVVSVVNRCRD